MGVHKKVVKVVKEGKRQFAAVVESGLAQGCALYVKLVSSKHKGSFKIVNIKFYESI